MPPTPTPPDPDDLPPLDDLLDDPDRPTHDVADALVALARLRRRDGVVSPLADPTTVRRVALGLLAQPVRVALADQGAFDVPVHADRVPLGPAALATVCELHVDELYPALRRLEQAGVVARRSPGVYFVPERDARVLAADLLDGSSRVEEWHSAVSR